VSDSGLNKKDNASPYTVEYLIPKR